MRKLLFVFIILTVLSISTNIFQYIHYHNEEDTPLPSAEDDYPLLASFVDRIPQKDRLINFTSLRDDLNNYVATQSSTLGMYFEYIPTGVSIGINQNQPFLYASLLKLPLVMAVYNERNRGNLSFSDKKLITSDMINYSYGSVWEKGVGAEITIEEAIKQSLIASDNTAFNILSHSIPIGDFERVFDSLDIPLIQEASEAAVTPKNYTSVLKSLVYSSYLPPKDSEEILELLDQSTYTDGIRKPIPRDIKVAHKMGIRYDSTYISDCGVIYHPNRPYYLCIMDYGRIDKSQTIIQELSRKIYNYIATQ